MLHPLSLYITVEGFDRSEKVLGTSFRRMRSNSHKCTSFQLGKDAEVCRQGKTVDMYNFSNEIWGVLSNVTL